MPMHIVEPNGVITVKHSKERSFSYDLPPGSFPKSLETRVEQNYRSIDAFQRTENNVKASEWAHFLSYLDSRGISNSKTGYLDSDDVNYIAGNLPEKDFIAATIPASSTLTYIVPHDYEKKVEEFAYRNSISPDLAETIVYLHEAMHNVLHDYRRSHTGSRQKESEVESALKDYFLHRAKESDSPEEKESYTKMADVCASRLHRLGKAVAAFSRGDISEDELAAMEEEILEGYDVIEKPEENAEKECYPEDDHEAA